MPSLFACGARGEAFNDFKTAHKHAKDGDFVAMLVDSEDPVEDIHKPWDHLLKRDGWNRRPGASDEQALLMATCMESWIAMDRAALRAHYGSCLREKALPPAANMENRDRRDVQNAFIHATRECKNKYTKGKQSFKVLGKLSPDALNALPYFQRFREILDRALP